MSEHLVWERDGHDWPNRDASRFVKVAGMRWHVQVMGQGPVALLLHGTGAATHSWRDLAPLLAQAFTVVAPDLPGHGFTVAPSDDVLSLPGMAGALGALLQTLAVEPALGIGHSAGAAILIRMTLDKLMSPRGLVSLNGALLPFEGVAGQIFSPIARALFTTAVAARLFAWRAEDKAVVRRLVDSTGSKIDPAGVELYRRLASNPGHVHAALGMMANWDLHRLRRELPRLAVPLLLIAGGNDRTVSPDEAFRVRDIIPDSKIDYLRGLGHLAHEERPQEIAAIIKRFAAGLGLLPVR
ncbi:MAG: alpha/beta fold hydrolase [Xanthobacteraceae bacterium]